MARRSILAGILALTLWGAATGAARAQDVAGIQAAVNEGQRLLDIGRPAEAEPLLRSASEQALTLWGQSSPDGGIITLVWAESVDAQGRFAAAEPIYRRALLLLGRSVEAGHPYLGRGWNDMAANLQSQGRYAEALAAAEQAFAIWSGIEGEAGSGSLTALSNQGVALKSLGRLGDAEARYRRVLNARTTAPDSLEFATIANNLGALLVEMDDVAQAEPLLRRAVEIREARLRPDDPLIGQSLVRLANALADLGRIEAAEAMQRRGVAVLERGPDGLDLISALGAQAALLVTVGKSDQAEAAATRSLEMAERLLNPTHPDVAAGLVTLADVKLSRGQAEEASALLKRAIAILEERLGADHASLIRPLFILALATGEGGDREEPIRLLRQSEQIAQGLPEAHLLRIGAQADLGAALAADRQSGEGMVLLRQAGDALIEKLGLRGGQDAGAAGAFEGWRRVYRLTVTAAWDLSQP